MEDLHVCSNLPYFDEKWEGGLEPKTYFVNMCKFNVDNWPDYLPNGFYKFVTQIFYPSGDLIVSVSVIEQIEQTGLLGK